MTDTDLDKLRQRTYGTDRIRQADADTPDSPEPADAFRDDLVETLQEVRRRERPSTYSADDDTLSAFLTTLQKNPDELQAVGDALRRAVGSDSTEELDKEDIIHLAVLVGLREAAPQHLERLAQAQVEVETDSS